MGMVTSPESPHDGSTTLLSTSEASADQTTFTMTTESNEDLSTTAMMVTSPEPPHHGSTTLLSTSEASADQTTFSMTTESNSSESVQGDGDLEDTPAPQQEDGPVPPQ